MAPNDALVFFLFIIFVVPNPSPNDAVYLLHSYLENRLHYNWDTDGAATSSSKRSTGHIEIEQFHWLKLSQLYRDLGEFDVVAGIFADKLAVNEQIPRAIAMEQCAQFEGAKDIYESVIERANEIERDFSYESYFRLLELMGDWTTLHTVCYQQLDAIDDVWTDNWDLECLLPHIMRAELRCVLAKDSRSRPFLNSIEQWVRVPDKSSYLTITFGEEMLMLQVANKDYRRARVYAEQHLSAFLGDWQNLTVLSDKVRLSKLLANRTVAEIYGYTDVLLEATGTNVRRQERVGELRERWCLAQPKQADSTRLWDSLLAYRKFIGEKLTADSGIPLSGCIIAGNVQLLDVALAQGNMSLSKRLIDTLKGQVPEKDLVVAAARQQSLKALRATTHTEARLTAHLRAWRHLDAFCRDATTDDDASAAASSRALEEISAIAMRMLPYVADVSNEVEANIRELMRIDAGPLDVSMMQYSLSCMQKCVDLIENAMDSSGDVSASSSGMTQSIGENYFKFAEYTQQPIAERIANIDATMIVAVLRAIQHGSVPARLFLPRILELPRLQEDATLKALFNKEVSEIPEWMFLRWVPQMLSTLPLTVPSFLDDIIVRIATTYPMAIIYPFRLKMCQPDADAVRRPVIENIARLVQHRTTDRFIEAVTRLGVPEKMLIYHLDELHKTNAALKQFRKSELVQRTQLIIDNFWPTDAGIVATAYERLEPVRLAILELQNICGKYKNLLASFA